METRRIGLNTMPHKILVVDDEPNILDVIETVLTRAGYDVSCADCGERAVEMSRGRPFDLVVTDIRMPGMSGMELLKEIKHIDADTQVIILTGHATLDMAVEAFKEHNAFDFLPKPQNRDNLLRSVSKALEHRVLIQQNRALMEQLKNRQEYLEDQNKKLIETRNALQASQSRFQDLYDNAPMGYLTVNSDGMILETNKMARELLGIAMENLVDLPFQALVHPDSQETFSLCRQKTAKNLAGSCEMTLMRPDGSKFEARIETKAITCQQSGQQHTRVVLTDMTDYKELQSRIIESRKLDAIATLAGGVAHQFNNALAGLMGYIELMQMDMAKKGHESPHAEPIFQLTERMAHLTRQLLAYAKGGQYTPDHLDLTALVELCINLVQNKIPKEVRLETDLPMDTGHVSADSTQMQMVLLALMQNAAEATSGEGRIRISARNTDIFAGDLKRHPKGRVGEFVCLSILDEGSGMESVTLKKIFDPFFTTKTIGRGLGLSAVYGIISNHGGWLEVDSTMGRGTEVRIYLERLEKKPAPVIDTPREATGGKGATVLLIEDEAPLMRATRQRLERMNYNVLEAWTGKQALEQLSAYKGSVDVALLDMRLPDINGDKLYYEMTAIDPDLKILLCSGYAIDEPVKQLLDNGAFGFLQKPFSLATLTEKLNGVIGTIQ